MTDISGICTTLLPEKLVGVFTPNRQSLYGLLDLVARVVEYRRSTDDFRPLSVFPLPSRVESAEKELREQWRRDYERQFQTLFENLYTSDRCDLSAYFDEVLLPHVSYYAYGESIAVLQERADAISLSAAYQRFVERLLKCDFAWETRVGEGTELQMSIQSHPVVEGEQPSRVPPGRVDSALMLPPNSPMIYISYARDDGEFAQQLAKDLKAAGGNIWMDKLNIRPWQRWVNEVEEALSKSTQMLVILSPSAVGSTSVMDEVAFAQDEGKTVIRVLYRDCKIPFRLRRFQFADFRTDYATGLNQMISALSGSTPAD